MRLMLFNVTTPKRVTGMTPGAYRRRFQVPAYAKAKAELEHRTLTRMHILRP